jgi:hypothetical protein
VQNPPVQVEESLAADDDDKTPVPVQSPKKPAMTHILDDDE